jgi:hypothetical protein
MRRRQSEGKRSTNKQLFNSVQLNMTSNKYRFTYGGVKRGEIRTTCGSPETMSEGRVTAFFGGTEADSAVAALAGSFVAALFPSSVLALADEGCSTSDWIMDISLAHTIAVWHSKIKANAQTILVFLLQ